MIFQWRGDILFAGCDQRFAFSREPASFLICLTLLSSPIPILVCLYFLCFFLPPPSFVSGFLSTSLCLSVPFCMYILSLTFLSLSLLFSLYARLCISLTFFYLSLLLSLYTCLSVFLFFIFLCFKYACLTLAVSPFLCLSLPLSISIFLRLFLPFFVCLCLSLLLFTFLYYSLSVICQSPFPSQTLQ